MRSSTRLETAVFAFRSACALPDPPRATVCVFALVLVASGALRAADRPNVILVMTDDKGYGDLSCHGNPVLKTPHLDRLHAESVRFTDFHVAPMCTPTRGQLMTGRDALDNGATFVCMGRSMMRRGLLRSRLHLPRRTRLSWRSEVGQAPSSRSR